MDRGYGYYHRGRVEDLYVSEDFIEAAVLGSDEYDVHIDMTSGNITNMSCNCPFADEGNYCKHMAALLFCWEDKIGNNEVEGIPKIRTEIGEGAEDSVTKLVNEADHVFVKNFLVGILKNDEKFLNRFKNALRCEISPEDMKRHKNQIKDIFRKFAGWGDFIDYYRAGEFVSELEDFLDDDIQGMLDNQHYKEAFELTNDIFVKIGNQDMDDSDGGIEKVATRCVEIWQEILEQCDKKFKKKMFRWYMEHLNGSIIDYMEDYIEHILFENFKEEEFLANKLAFTEAKVSEFKRGKDSWSRGYYVGKWAIRHIAVMQEQKAPQTKIDDYCKRNLEFDKIRKYYVGNCIKRKDYDSAVHVLEEGKKIDKDSAGIVADYSLQLKKLYKQRGNDQAYKKELWSLVLKYKAGDMTIFKELKSLYTEKEWEEKREIIFEKLHKYAGIDKLYEVEKLYDRLLKNVLDSPGLYKLTEYEKCLKKLYPQELLNKYETVVENMASHTSDRKRYREIVAILRRMRKYPQGKEKVEKIVTDWRTLYRNRRAMMDELKKL
jgi:hypothetical protein